MEDAVKLATAFFAGIIGIAILSVIVGPKSKAPAAISGLTSGVAKVVEAAVNPVTQQFGFGSGSQTYASPSSYQPGWNPAHVLSNMSLASVLGGNP